MGVRHHRLVASVEGVAHRHIALRAPVCLPSLSPAFISEADSHVIIAQSVSAPLRSVTDLDPVASCDLRRALATRRCDSPLSACATFSALCHAVGIGVRLVVAVFPRTPIPLAPHGSKVCRVVQMGGSWWCRITSSRRLFKGLPDDCPC